MMRNDLVVMTGNAHRALGELIAANLNIDLLQVDAGRFSDGEIQIKIGENIRGTDVFIVQPTMPPAENIMELLLLIDAVRRASCRRVTAVIPYFGYARQDRKDQPRVPIAAKLMADLITTAGANRVLTIDLHAPQIQGFFDIPLDNVYSTPLMLADIWKRFDLKDMVVVAPDVGGVVRARAIAKRLDDADLAIIDKRRPRANESVVMNIIGDIEGRDCILIDDIADTAGTLCKAAAALKQHGARRVCAYIVHPVLSGPAIQNIQGSALDELVVTDTIPLREDARACGRIRSLSVADMLAETIRRIAEGESVSELYLD
jgi:ribose-phosphate pyrophosphokinase